MKNLFVKCVALSIFLILVGCEKNRNVNDPTSYEETTTPHSMESEPVTNNKQLNDDTKNDSTAPVLIEEGASGIQTGSSTSDSSRLN